MASTSETNSYEEIRTLLSRMNEAWPQGHTEGLNEYFHSDVVVKGPEFQEVAKGRTACVKSYEDFIRVATVQEFKASEPRVDLLGSMAVAMAVVPWEIRYRMNERDYHESGHDLLALTREEDRWQVIWRAVLPS